MVDEAQAGTPPSNANSPLSLVMMMMGSFPAIWLSNSLQVPVTKAAAADPRVGPLVLGTSAVLWVGFASLMLASNKFRVAAPKRQLIVAVLFVLVMTSGCIFGMASVWAPDQANAEKNLRLLD